MLTAADRPRIGALMPPEKRVLRPGGWPLGFGGWLPPQPTPSFRLGGCTPAKLFWLDWQGSNLQPPGLKPGALTDYELQSNFCRVHRTLSPHFTRKCVFAVNPISFALDVKQKKSN